MKYDQHFLIDKGIIKKTIEEADLRKEDIVLEIGSGKGVLTKELAKHSKVIAIEIDKSLELKLKNVKLIYGNALKLIERLKFNKIVSNIPYSITEPLFNKLLKIDFELAVLLIGKKFYKLINDERSKWSVIISQFYEVIKLADVSKNSFQPKPRTDSVLIKLIPKEKNKPINKFVLQSDKKLKNALLKILLDSGLTKKQAKEKLREMKIPDLLLEKNVGYLSNKEFRLVYRKLHQ